MNIRLNQWNTSVFLLAKPAQWALRYGDRPKVDCPLFVRYEGRNARQRQAVLLDIFGQKDLRLDAPTDSPDDPFCFMIPDRIVEVLSRPKAVTAKTAASLVLGIAHHEAPFSDGWQEMRDLIERDRYEAHAWFERDRKNLCLTDLFTNTEVVSLWDDDVEQAIEDGFLRPPRPPRPKDRDWLEPLLAYARSQDALAEPVAFEAAGADANTASSLPRARLT